MNAQTVSHLSQPAGRVTLTDEQMERLEAAIIRRHSYTFVDRYGITRTTQAARNEFVSSLVDFHKARGYLTQNQYARVAYIVEAGQ